ncbi:hypothetical protein OROGR_021160 [Orobanche gracilis]
MRKGNKPTEEPTQSPTKPAEENNHAAEQNSKAAGKGRAKRPKVAEPECFPEKWNLQLTLIGTEICHLVATSQSVASAPMFLMHSLLIMFRAHSIFVRNSIAQNSVAHRH